MRVFEHGGRYYELESWTSPHAGLNLLKTSVETSAERLHLPPFIEVASEVTDDLSYSTHALAKKH